MVTPIKIAVAEPSSIVRSGLEAQLRKLLHYKAQIIYLLDDNRREWQDIASVISADIFIINPLLTGPTPRACLPHLPEHTKLIALCYGLYDTGILKEFDAAIHLADSRRSPTPLISSCRASLQQRPSPRTHRPSHHANVRSSSASSRA